MKKEQINFFEELAYIQEYCVNVSLSKEDKYCNTEELLKDVTGEVINEGIELHDKCVEFLESPYNANE